MSSLEVHWWLLKENGVEQGDKGIADAEVALCYVVWDHAVVRTFATVEYPGVSRYGRLMPQYISCISKAPAFDTKIELT